MEKSMTSKNLERKRTIKRLIQYLQTKGADIKEEDQILAEFLNWAYCEGYMDHMEGVDLKFTN